MPALTSVSGFPRIGQNRELKKIIEAYWKGAASLDEVRGTAKELRAKHWKLQAQAGVDLIPSNDFSYYDQMLDTAILLNVIPQRYKRLAFTNPEETLFAMGRGYQGDKGDVTPKNRRKNHQRNQGRTDTDVGKQHLDNNRRHRGAQGFCCIH